MNTLCKKNVQKERKVMRNYYFCKQNLQNVRKSRNAMSVLTISV